MKPHALNESLGTSPAALLSILLAALLVSTGLAFAINAVTTKPAHAKATSISIGTKRYSGAWNSAKQSPVKSFKYKKVTWNAKTQTLTLKKVKKVKKIRIEGTGTIKIKVVGSCTLKKNADIYAFTNLKFTGKGSLTLSGNSCEIEASKVTVAGPKITLKNPQRGFVTEGLTLTKGKVTVTNTQSCGVRATSGQAISPQVKVTGGSLKITGKPSYDVINATNFVVTGGTVSIPTKSNIYVASHEYHGKRYGGYVNVTGGSVAVGGTICGERGTVKCAKISTANIIRGVYFSNAQMLQSAPTFTHVNLKKVNGVTTPGGTPTHYVCPKCKMWTHDAAGKKPMWEHTNL